MQCDGQYCLTEMENFFVGQVICRNCGFSLVSHSLFLFLTFSRSYCQFPFLPRSRKLHRGTTNRTTNLVLIMRPLKNVNKFCNRAFSRWRILYFFKSLSRLCGTQPAATMIKSAHSVKRNWMTPNIIIIF